MNHSNKYSFSSSWPKLALAAAVVCASLVAASEVRADEPTAAELRRQIEKLQEQVQKLEAAQAAQPAASDAAAQRVLADAERRAARSPVSLMSMDDEVLVGHNGKQFQLTSPSGDFLLVPNIQIQLRHVTNANNENGDSFEDIENGMEVRRAKVGVKGHAFTKALKYDLKWAFNRDGGAAGLENAYIEYVPDQLLGVDDMGLRAGQFKDMTFIEESVSSSKQTAVDRSLVNESIGGGNTDYIQGIGPIFKGERLRGGLFYTDGANSDNTPWHAEMWDYGFAGRADFIVTGDADSVLEDFTAMGTEENSARVGAGFHWSAMGDSRVLWHGIDGQYETAGGLGILAAYYGRWADVDDVDTFDLGGLLQVSQTFGEGWEGFVRYDFIIFEEDVVVGTDAEDFFHEIGAGVNRYFEGHKSKVTVDVIYLPDGNPGSNTGIGLRPSNGEFDDQMALRLQYQLAI